MGKMPPQNGFTLLEVLVAFSFTAIVLLGVYQIHSQTIVMETINRFNGIAPILAQQQLSASLAEEDGSLSDDEGTFDAPFDGYHWQVTTTNIESEYLGELSKRFKRIHVRIEYEGNGYDIETYHFFRSEP